MNKKDVTKLAKLFDEIEFIEQIEKMAKQSKGHLDICISSPAHIFGELWFADAVVPVPEDMSSFLIDALIGYKETLIETVDSLQVVDKTTIQPKKAEKK